MTIRESQPGQQRVSQLYSFLLVPALLSLIGFSGVGAGEESTPLLRPAPTIVATPPPTSGPRKLSPFLPPRPAKLSPPATPEPPPPSPSPSPTREPPRESSTPANPAVPAPHSTPAPEGPPAKPPAPPPEGLQSMPIAPVQRGPAIPVPGLKKKRWGDDDWQDDPDGTVYGGILGTVKDKVTDEALENVEISLPELDLRALSDKSGLFMIRGIRVRPRGYELLLKFPGYQTRFESLELLQKGTLKQDFLLTPMGW